VDIRDGRGTRDRFVLRIYPVGAIESEFCRREAVALGLLANSGIPAPGLLWSDPTGRVLGPPAMAITLMPGTPWRQTGRASQWEQMAGTLARIHAQPVSPKLERYRRAKLDNVVVDSALISTVRREWAQPSHEAAVFLHGDYCMPNSLWRRGSLCAIVDWNFCRAGPPSVDVASLWLDAVLFGEPGSGRAVLQSYKASGGHQCADLRTYQLHAAALAQPMLDRWLLAFRSVAKSELTLADLRVSLDHAIGELLATGSSRRRWR